MVRTGISGIEDRFARVGKRTSNGPLATILARPAIASATCAATKQRTATGQAAAIQRGIGSVAKGGQA